MGKLKWAYRKQCSSCRKMYTTKIKTGVKVCGGCMFLSKSGRSKPLALGIEKIHLASDVILADAIKRCR